MGIGWIYTITNGTTWFQLAGTFSVSAGVNLAWLSLGAGVSAPWPAVAYSSSGSGIVGSINAVLQFEGLAGKVLPPPFNLIMSGKLKVNPPLNCYK